MFAHTGILGNNDHNNDDNKDSDGKDARTQQPTCGWMHSWQGGGVILTTMTNGNNDHNNNDNYNGEGKDVTTQQPTPVGCIPGRGGNGDLYDDKE